MPSIFNTDGQPPPERQRKLAFIWQFRRDLVAQWPTLTPEQRAEILNGRTLPAPQQVTDLYG